MNNNDMLINLILGKIGSLSHDPYTKPWIILDKKFKGHENKARDTIEKLFPSFAEVIEDLLWDKIKEADMLAASIDRRFLSPMYSEDSQKVYGESEKLLVYKNIFNPENTLEISSQTDIHKEYESYIEDLRKLIEDVKDPVDIYHILYSSVELLWIHRRLPLNPADTRIPNHTVFDHNYAVATVFNWTFQDDGFLVRLDLGGIHDFISSSRKVRDLWSSSFLASLIVWHAITSLIWYLGPDILITPTARFNPFYYSMLMNKLKKEGYFNENDDLKKNVLDFLKELFKRDLYEEYFPYAILPASVTLALPSIEIIKKGFEKYISSLEGSVNRIQSVFKKFDEASKDDEVNALRVFFNDLINVSWEEIIHIIIEYFTDKKDLLPHEELIKEFLKETNFEELIKDLHIDSTPPFIVRIGVASLTKAKEILRNNHIDSADHNLYSVLLELLDKDMKNLQKFRRSPFSKLKLSKFTEEYFLGWRARDDNFSLGYPDKSMRGYDYCTMCGELPAVLVFNNNSKYFKESFKPYFSQGEKLCPYCFLKRIFTFGEVTNRVLNKVFGGKGELSFTPPSVSDLSTLSFRMLLLKSAEEYKSFYDELNKKGIQLNFSISNIPGISKKGWKLYDDYLYKLKPSDIEEINLKYLALIFLGAEESNMWLSSEEMKRKWAEIAQKINEDFWKIKYPNRILLLPSSPGIYYAVLYADGDRMGKLLSGKLYDAVIMPKSISLENNYYLDKNLFIEITKFYAEYICNTLNIKSIRISNDTVDIKQLIETIYKSIEKNVDKIFSLIECKKSQACYLEDLDKIIKIVKSDLKKYKISENILNQYMTLFLNYLFKLKLKKDASRNKLIWILDPGIPVSMAYQTAISKSLMINALNDINVIYNNYGVVILAGGDDLLALSPIYIFDKLDIELKDYQAFKNLSSDIFSLKNTLLDVLSKIRIAYSDGELNLPEKDLEQKGLTRYIYREYRKKVIRDLFSNKRGSEGFYSFKFNYPYVIPLLNNLGRSIAVTVTHYKYPMYIALTQNNIALDKFAKDSSKWIYENNMMQSRDGLVVQYITGGIPIHVTLPNKIWISELKYSYTTYNILKLIVDHALYKLLTKSFIRDLLNDPLLTKYEDFPEEYLKDYLKYVINRNIPRYEKEGGKIDPVLENSMDYLINLLFEMSAKVSPDKKSLISKELDGSLVRRFVKAGNIFLSGMR